MTKTEHRKALIAELHAELQNFDMLDRKTREQQDREQFLRYELSRLSDINTSDSEPHQKHGGFVSRDQDGREHEHNSIKDMIGEALGRR